MKKILSLFLVFIFALTSSIAIFASGSSFVNGGDGMSYEGLPAFPTVGQIGNLFIKLTDYTLFERDGDYMLFAFPQRTKLNLSDNYAKSTIRHHLISGSSSEKIYYNDYACTQPNTDKEYSYLRYRAYRLIDGEWSVIYEPSYGAGYKISTYGYTVLSSTQDIYTDYTFKKVFFKSVTTPSLSGMSPTEIKKMTLGQMVGLIPLVIGLLMVLIAFYKGWAFLRRLLQTA